MKILKEENVVVLNIEYSNDDTLFDRDAVYYYLDQRFGETGYRVKRSGPHPNKVGRGLIVVHAESKDT